MPQPGSYYPGMKKPAKKKRPAKKRRPRDKHMMPMGRPIK